MYRKLWILFACVFLTAACSVQTAVLAPRRTPTPDHVAASSNGDCVDCHGVARIADHDADDNCMGCHRMAQER